MIGKIHGLYGTGKDSTVGIFKRPNEQFSSVENAIAQSEQKAQSLIVDLKRELGLAPPSWEERSLGEKALLLVKDGEKQCKEVLLNAYQSLSVAGKLGLKQWGRQSWENNNPSSLSQLNLAAAAAAAAVSTTKVSIYELFSVTKSVYKCILYNPHTIPYSLSL